MPDKQIKEMYYIMPDGTERKVLAAYLVTSPGVERQILIGKSYITENIAPPNFTVSLTGSPNPAQPGDLVTLTILPVGGVAPYTSFAFARSLGAPALSGGGTSQTRTFIVPAAATAGTVYSYTLTATDSVGSTASFSYSVGVQAAQVGPTPLSATLSSTPVNPVTRGTVVTLTARPTGGTPPYTYAFTTPVGAPALTGTGASRTFAVPSAAAVPSSWSYEVSVGDSGDPAQTATASKVVQVGATTGFNRVGVQTKVIQGWACDNWDVRIADMDPGALQRIKARRIFVSDFSNLKWSLIEDTLAAGNLPCVSYPYDATVTAGTLDATAIRLNSYGQPIVVVFKHEPSGAQDGAMDIPANWVAYQKKCMPFFKQQWISRGCYLNGFLIHSQSAKVTQYLPNDLLDAAYFDGWIGADIYQPGDRIENGGTGGGTPTPRQRTQVWLDYMDGRGLTDWLFGIGEWNSHSPHVLADSFKAWTEMGPRVWHANVWNSFDEPTQWDGTLTGNYLHPYRDNLRAMEDSYYNTLTLANKSVGLATSATPTTSTQAGTYLPVNSYGPANFASIGSLTPVPSTAWALNQHIVMRDGRFARWNGTAWVSTTQAV